MQAFKQISLEILFEAEKDACLSSLSSWLLLQIRGHLEREDKIKEREREIVKVMRRKNYWFWGCPKMMISDEENNFIGQQTKMIFKKAEAI